MSPALEAMLRPAGSVVTPAMYRIHHSVELAESNRNFGFDLPWWDRLLRTYLDRPARDPRRMPLGVARHRSADALDLPWLIDAPFRPEARASGAIDERGHDSVGIAERPAATNAEPERLG